MTLITAASFTYADCAFAVTCNGWPILDTDCDSTGFVTIPLNAELVAGENVLQVTVSRRGAEAAIGLRLDHQETGTFVDSNQEPQVELGAADTFEHRFESTVNHLGELLAQCQPSSAAAMTAYAMELGQLFAAGDTQTLLTHFEPKLAQVAAAFGMPLEAAREQFTGMLGFFAGTDFAISPDTVTPRPFCGDRLWKLQRPDGTELCSISDDEGSFNLEIVAAQTGDGLRVVK